MDLLRIADELVAELSPLEFGPPVTHVYNPLVYAREPYAQYVARYGQGPREVMLLGMNPGPFGMAQTGVPFGDVQMAREYLGIEAPVGVPSPQHPRRPVLGFGCKRREVSGQRIWGWARETFGPPAQFFSRFFVYNYCPLVFMEASGRNRTPDALPASERLPLFAACDRALARTAACLQVRTVIGVGRFAEQRAHQALGPMGVTVVGVMHPSPANPNANRGWSQDVSRRLRELGLLEATGA